MKRSRWTCKTGVHTCTSRCFKIEGINVILFAATSRCRRAFGSGYARQRSTRGSGRTRSFCWCCRRCSSSWTYLKSLTFLYQSWGTSSTKFTTTITKCRFTTSGIASAWRKWQVHEPARLCRVTYVGVSASNCHVFRFRQRLARNLPVDLANATWNYNPGMLIKFLRYLGANGVNEDGKWRYRRIFACHAREIVIKATTTRMKENTLVTLDPSYNSYRSCVFYNCDK